MKVAFASAANIKTAAEILAAGGLVISPTDSVYGLFCNALDEDAVGRVRGVKGRDEGKPLQVAVRKEDAEKYSVLDASARRIIKQLWPGDVNVIVTKRDAIKDFISKDTVCLTCHSNPVARRLVEQSGRPLVSTSANFSGDKPPTSVDDINPRLMELVDMVLDGGETRNKKPNTIVDSTKSPVEILREGLVSRKQIMDLML